MASFTNDRLKRIIYAGAILVIAGYALFETHALIAGPSVSIQNPKNGSVLSTATTTISGVAKRISFLTLNGNQIYVDKAGQFSESLPLLPGYNILLLEARDSFGRHAATSLELIYTPAH